MTNMIIVTAPYRFALLSGPRAARVMDQIRLAPLTARLRLFDNACRSVDTAIERPLDRAETAEKLEKLEKLHSSWNGPNWD